MYVCVCECSKGNEDERVADGVADRTEHDADDDAMFHP